MLAPQNIANALLFSPMAAIVTYMDVRYRRIPNRHVLVILVGGVALNAFFGGWNGLVGSLGGCAIAFGSMFMLHAFGTMGAGDVKLCAAVGSVIGVAHIWPTLLIIALTGGVLAVIKMIHARRVAATMFGVLQFFYGFLPGQTVPHLEVPVDHSYTLPYAVPICLGGLISIFLYSA